MGEFMASMIPAFFTAMQDRELKGAPREVYVWCHEHLDVVRHRAVKHSAIESALSINDATVACAISRLLERGYLERGTRDGRLWTYRLVYSNPDTAPGAILPL